MKTALVFSLLLASLSMAVPMGKRDIEWVTLTEYETVTIDVTTTIYVHPTAGPKAQGPPVVPSLTTSHNNPAQFYAPRPSQPGKLFWVTPAVFFLSPIPNTALEATTTTSSSSSTTTSTPEPTPEPKVTPQAQPYVPPPPPPPSPSPEVSAQKLAPPPAASSPSGSGNGQCTSGSPCSGDMTYYDAGLGSCGDTNDGNTERVVALPHGLMGLQSNGNPYCGKTITIKYGGKTTTAIVKDKCMGCVSLTSILTFAFRVLTLFPW